MPDPLLWHEIVNTRFAGEPVVVVAFCPLCGTGLAVSRALKEHTLRFGAAL